MGPFQLSLLLGSTLVLTRQFDPGRCLDLVEKHGCDALVVAPVMLQRILAEVGPWSAQPQSYDVRTLRVVAASGSSLSAELAVQWMDTYGDNLFNVYGSTEVAWATIATPPELRAARGTAGRPPPGTQVRIYGDDDVVQPAGQTGRIFVQNSMLFRSYTDGGSLPLLDQMMATGDLGHLDAAGRLFIDGRADEMIVSGGENVFPQEIEEVLSRHPAVSDVAVAAVDDQEFGQRLRAFVVRRTDATVSADELRQHVGAQLARFKTPRDVVFVDTLPRNAAGKVMRRELAAYDLGDEPPTS